MAEKPKGRAGRAAKKRSYSDDDKANALAALKANGGNVLATAKQLGIPRKTLERWAHGRHIDPAVAQIGHEKEQALAIKLERIAHLLVDSMPGKIDDAKLNQVAVALGITIEKMRLLLDKPTQIHGNDLTDAERLARLAALFDRAQRAEMDSLLAGMEIPLWEPFPNSPQADAYASEADELFYGGAAGGGKTDLALGPAITAHKKTLFLRREAVQLTRAVGRLKAIVGNRGSWRSSGHGGTMNLGGRMIELGGCEHEDDKLKYQGHDDDLKVLDELPHFSRSQYRFIIGWNRTDDPQQRCRVVCAGNPPTTPEARWVVEEWAPWLDSQYPNPARPGELRWYTVIDEKLTWLPGPEPVRHKGEILQPRSRTFIPARVQDNPVYMATGYMATLQAMPEPLRSQMLYGDFNAGMEDDPWQVIPTGWIQAAQARWRPDGGLGPDGNLIALSCLGMDVAHGGDDQTVLARRYKTWFAPLEKHAGKTTPDGQTAAALVVKALLRTEDRRTPVHIDVIGYGASAHDICKEKVPGTRAVNFSASAMQRDRTGVLEFANLRAWAYWSLRDALDPNTGDTLALPPDPELVADLTAPHWKMTASGIIVESKPDIVKRIGRSPDCGDAVVLAALPWPAFTAPQRVEPERLSPYARMQGAGRESRAAARGLYGRGGDRR